MKIVKVYNDTRGTLIGDQIKKADNFFTIGKGLMLSPPLPPGHGMIITQTRQIHMFFMRFPLDLIYGDRAHKVVKVTKGIKPWRIGPHVSKAAYVIELPPGTLDRTPVEVGDQLRWAE